MPPINYLFNVTGTPIGSGTAQPNQEKGFSFDYDVMLGVFAASVDTDAHALELTCILVNSPSQSTQSGEETKKAAPAKARSSSEASKSKQNIITRERPFSFKKAPEAKRKRCGRERQYANTTFKNPKPLDRKTRRLTQKFPIQQPRSRG